MPGVFLVGEEWSPRALLRAQLLEEGVSVEAFETAGEAVQAMDASVVLPPLVIADLSSSDDPRGDVGLLAPLARAVPIWIIAGKTVTASTDLEGRGFERVLLKPLDAGKLVEQIKRRLERGRT
jgi:DNA-binding NtrC family response regulator